MAKSAYKTPVQRRLQRILSDSDSEDDEAFKKAMMQTISERKQRLQKMLEVSDSEDDEADYKRVRMQSISKMRQKNAHTAPVPRRLQNLLSDSESEDDDAFKEAMMRRISERNKLRLASQKNRIGFDWSKSDSEDEELCSQLRLDCTSVHQLPLKRSKNGRKDDDSEYFSKDEATHKSDMPQEAHQLDDYELEVYNTLKMWRHHRKNELDVEAHNKIISERTLCELVRKRRNDLAFAYHSSDKDYEAVEQDLLSLWGIGPFKVAPGGAAWELLEVLDTNKNMKLLKLSRQGGGKLRHAWKVKGNRHGRTNSKKFNRTQTSPKPISMIPKYITFKRRSFE